MSSTRKVTIARRKPGQTGRKTTTRTSDSRRFAADSLCRQVSWLAAHYDFRLGVLPSHSKEQWRVAS